MATETTELVSPGIVNMEIGMVNMVKPEDFLVAARRRLMDRRERIGKHPRKPRAVCELDNLSSHLDSNKARARLRERLGEKVELLLIKKLEATMALDRSPKGLGALLDKLRGPINAYNSGFGRDKSPDRHLRRLVVAGCLALKLGRIKRQPQDWEDAAEFLKMAHTTAMSHEGFNHLLEGKLEPLLEEAETNMPAVPAHKPPYWTY